VQVRGGPVIFGRTFTFPIIRVLRVCLTSGLSMSTAACSGAPSVAVLGAYFPDWLFCIAGGVLIVACVHIALSRKGQGNLLKPAAVIYPVLTVIFSVGLWVAGFNL
jgi:hypothetical protein